MVTLLSLYVYTVETDFVYRTLVFFSERMDARHDDVAVVEQQLWSSRLLGLGSFFPGCIIRALKSTIRRSSRSDRGRFACRSVGSD